MPVHDGAILIPACDAHAFIERAVRSAVADRSLDVEVVICADDGSNYVDWLRNRGLAEKGLVHCSTGRVRSGAPNARNTAARSANARFLACLDADDELCEGRLRALIDAAEKQGVATGPTYHVEPDGRVSRTAAPGGQQTDLCLADIVELRMPFFPLFHSGLLGDGWPNVKFAEDMIFNVMLYERAGGYAFVRSAGYRYHQREGSLSHSAGTFADALTGYRQILELAERGLQLEEARAVVRRAIGEDIRMVEDVRAIGDVHEARRQWHERRERASRRAQL